MIDLVGLNTVEELDKVGRVRDVAVMQKQMDVINVRVFIEVVNTPRVKGRGAANDAVNLIALRQEQFRQVGPVLPRDAGDDCFLHL